MLYIDREMKANSADSVSGFIGKEGRFEAEEFNFYRANRCFTLAATGKYYIFTVSSLYLLCNFSGQCPLVDSARKAANINRLNCFNTHFTFALVIDKGLPMCITDVPVGNSRKTQMAEGVVAILATSPNNVFVSVDNELHKVKVQLGDISVVLTSSQVTEVSSKNDCSSEKVKVIKRLSDLYTENTPLCSFVMRMCSALV